MASPREDALSPIAALDMSPITRHMLLQPVVRRIGLAMVIFSYLWAMAIVASHHPDPHWRLLLGPVALMLPALAALGLTGSYPAASAAIGVGLCLATLTQVEAGAYLTGQWLAMLTALVIGLLAGPPGAAAIAVALTAAAFTLGVPSAEQWPLVRQALLGAGVAVLVGEDIVHALAHAEASETRAWQLAREAMHRRGELHRTSKMLHDMYALLERTNGELEVARREAEEAREIKARFAANISHELRTPLNLIMGFSRMMYRSPEVYGDVRWTPALRADIREVHGASRHLLGMIDDVLDLARIDAQRLPLKLEHVALGDLIAEATATARGLLRASTVTLSTDVPPDLPEIVADRTRVRQVLLNLLNNAIRFTDAGSIVVSAGEEGGEVAVTVTDTGVGIAAEDLPGIFDEFSQARGPITSGRGGAGLGLAVCKQFVHLHGGRISATSEPGKGSAFRFTIPLPGSGKSRSRLSYYSPEGWSPPLASGSLGKSVVALTADETAARHLARGIEGYRVIPVASLAALPAVVEAEHPAGVVVVRDPLAADGAPAAEEVARAVGRPDVGVVEWEVPAESAAMSYLQADGYLVKPVEVEKLVATIRGSGARTDRLLVVDDDPGFRELIQRVVSAAFPRAAITLCAGGAEALRALQRQSFDLVMIDLVMPGLDGIGLLRRAREAGVLSGKVIVTTGAPYVEELATLFAPSLRFSKRSLPRGMEWFRAIKALLDAAPPDYSLPAVAPALPADPQPQSAS